MHISNVNWNGHYISDVGFFLQDNYDDMFVKKVYSTPLLSIGEVTSQQHGEYKTVRVQYTDKAGFKAMAKQLGIMDDLKVRRCFFLFVSVIHQGYRTECH